MDRRIFLKAATVIGAGVAASVGLTRRIFAAESIAALGERPEQTRQGDMIYRTLGRTGERVSAIGLGGLREKLKAKTANLKLKVYTQLLILREGNSHLW